MFIQKFTIVVSAILSVILISSNGECKTTKLDNDIGNLETEWLFQTDPGDIGMKEGWSTPPFNDTAWKTIRVPGYWESQGFNSTDPKVEASTDPLMKGYDGVAWYRLRFTMPSEWAGKDLTLSLGSVDDQDQVYLNGTLVGATGPGIEQSVLIQRQYKIPAARFLQDKENVLSIRVVDNGGPGGMVGPYVFLLPENVFKSSMTVPQSDRPLAARFMNPAAENRILKIIHSWPDEPDSQDTLRQLLILQGFGGVVCNLSFNDYLQSETRWTALKRALDEAKKSGMAMWLYDEKGYPSGTAGGLTMKGHPEWEVRGLLYADEVVDGKPVQITVPPGKIISAYAYPLSTQSIDISAGINIESNITDGKLSWQPSSGKWHVMVITESVLYDHTFASASFGDRIPYINLLMPEPTARFLELAHQQYAAHLGSDLGKYFISTFTDEPSLMNRWVDQAPYRAIPWAPNLPGEFKKRRGYDIQPLIPLLVGESDVKSARVRYDFWKTIGELVSENFFGQIETWCKAHNVASGGHLVQEEPLMDHVAFYGNFFQCLRKMGAPGIDCLTSVPSQVPPHIGRMISSAADLEGKTLTMSETSDFGQIYRAAGDTRPITNVTEDEIKGTCNRLFLSGINTITSYYSWTGINSKQIRRLNEWVGRCSTMLQGGHHASDIAVLYPAESVWPKFTPSKSGPTDSASAMKVEQIFNSVSDALYASRREFSYIDTRTISEARIEGGTLVYGKLKWRVLILPGVDTLPMSAWKKLQEFQKGGGIVIAAGALPANSDTEFPSTQVKGISRLMFGGFGESKFIVNLSGGMGIYIPFGDDILLAAALDSIIERDVTTSDRSAPIRMTHRSIDGYEVFFIINDGAKPWSGTVSVAATGEGQLFNLSDGQISSLSGPNNIKLDLAPYDAVILRFAKSRPLARFKVTNGALPLPSMKPLPFIKPTVTNGQYVNCELQGNKDEKQSWSWKVVSTLTKGQTDTFAFLLFSYPQLLDMSATDLISFDTWVPEGQNSTAKMIMMLHEKDGGDYFIDTNRSLNASGYQKLIIPIDRFQLAPWSSDKDGQLNIKQIERIVIGWGGYFGNEGEKLEFSVGNPLIGKFPK
ncbi:MAG: glycosyl hydrolase [Armatimonadota bacterium]